MKKLLEAINRGILRGLNEQNIELLADLDDCNLDQLDSMKTKNINNKMQAVYRYFPKTKEELAEIIKVEVDRKGWNCNLNHIDVSQITDMSYLFGYSDDNIYDLYQFNGDISKWNVSNVINMQCMFFGNPDFNGNISNWDVSRVKNMSWLFCQTKFNKDISEWDVSNVESMYSMFKSSEFNGDISKWDVSKVKYMKCMFSNSEFNKDISKWKINTNCNKEYMFDCCPIKKEFKPKD